TAFIRNDMAGLTLLWLLSGVQVYLDNLPIEHPAIRYSEEADDRVARLAQELESGKVRLESDPKFSYLPSLLERLEIPSESQTLVFSKTSVQESRVSPRTPRAIYFRDDVAVGYVRGSDTLELAAVDPVRGIVFYTLEARSDKAPRIARADGCLHCHQGAATAGVPGIYVGSVATTPSGRVDFRPGSMVTDHRTAFADRWGGWYVDGSTSETHRANVTSVDPELSGALPVLPRDRSSYLASGSDIVALMTLEHQTQMTNLLTRLSWEARIDSIGPASPGLEARIGEVARYLLFLDETPLSGPIRGVSGFAEAFAREGPRDKKGRSLREFDLKTRLFRYPLSYLVHSRQFEGLPAAVRERLYRRLKELLPEDERPAIVEILRDTKGDLPPGW
ncbi:MAG TPA: hypothetical protein VIG29_12595, partial [Vicinamibacteria bacterium]